MLADSRFSSLVAFRLSLKFSLPIVFNIGQNGVSYEGERSNGSFIKVLRSRHLSSPWRRQMDYEAASLFLYVKGVCSRVGPLPRGFKVAFLGICKCRV